MSRYGLTIPIPNRRLHQHKDLFRRIVDLGYSDVWSAEVNGSDGLTPLALAAAWAPELRVGVAILPAYTRGPALLAQSAAALADAAPGRVAIGIGSSSNVIVERWNGVNFDRPYYRTRDVVRFMKSAFAGEKISHGYDTFEVDGFRLESVPEQEPSILVAALREGMLRMAGREADGAIINWLSPQDVKTVVPIVHDAAPEGAEREIVARLFVCPSDDAETVRQQARFAIAAYMNVPVYAAFHEWLGRGPRMQGMWDAWKAGDRKAALAAIPDSVVDDLVVHGSPEQCRERIDQYLANGVDTVSITVMEFAGVDTERAIADLAPRG